MVISCPICGNDSCITDELPYKIKICENCMSEEVWESHKQETPGCNCDECQYWDEEIKSRDRR